MQRKLFLFAFLLTLAPALLHAQEKEKKSLLVNTFTVAANVPFPYDLKQLQIQTVTELKIKDSQYFEVISELPAGQKAAYTLDGEIKSWHAGNRAKRMMVGMGSGRETAEIHYWLTDANGKRAFEHTDTIRQAYWGNAYANSVGQLAQPFADKIADRLKEAKLY